MSLQSLFEAQNYSEVVSQHSVLSTPDSDDDLVAAGAYFRLNNFLKALELLEPHYQLLADNDVYLSIYGACLRRLGRLDEALSVFEHGVSICSSNPNYMNNYSNLLVDLKRYDQAIEILEDLTRTYPDYLDASLNLQRAKDLRDSPPVPDSNTQDLLNTPFTIGEPLNPLFEAFADDEKLYSLANFIKNAKSDQASSSKSLSGVTKLVSDVDVAKKVAPSVADMHKLAQINVQTNPSLTVDLCNKLVDSGASPDALYSLVAEAFLHLRKLDFAETYYLKAFALGQSTPDILGNLAQLSLIKGSLADAKSYIERGMSLYPDDSNLKLIFESISKAPSGNTPKFDSTSS